MRRAGAARAGVRPTDHPVNRTGALRPLVSPREVVVSLPIAFSVIVPSYRSAPTIGACLTALLRQDLAQPYEIIVVDSSPDETPALVGRDFPQVRLIHRAQQTDPALARNLGAEQAHGEIL